MSNIQTPRVIQKPQTLDLETANRFSSPGKGIPE